MMAYRRTKLQQPILHDAFFFEILKIQNVDYGSLQAVQVLLSSCIE